MHCKQLNPGAPINYPTLTEFVELISTRTYGQLKKTYSSCDLILTAVGNHSLNECLQTCPIDVHLPCRPHGIVHGNHPYSFGILMNFNKDGKLTASAADATQGTKSFQCSDESLSSARTLFCVANACDGGYVLQNGKCVSSTVPALVITTTVFRSNRNIPPIPILAADITNVLGLMTWHRVNFELIHEEFRIQTEYMK